MTPRPVRLLRAACLVSIALCAPAARAHRGEAKRDLRLQLEGTQLEGLLQYTLPPGREVQRLMAAPPGLIPGERPGASLEETLGARVAIEALRGLAISFGPDEAHLQAAPIRLVEAKARKTQTGGLEALLLVRVEGAAITPGLIELSSTAKPRVRALLTAPKNGSLSLASGVGKASTEGLSLRPREGLPCRIRVVRRALIPPAPPTPAYSAGQSL